MSPDRAKLELRSTPVTENPKHNGHLPRWLLNPIFAARLTAAALVGLGGAAIGDSASSINPANAAETTTQCTGSITELAFRYFDRYPVDKIGEENFLDKDDFVLGPLPRQTVYIYDKDKKPFNPPKSAILEPGPDSGKVHFEITKGDKINCDGKNPQGEDYATVYLELETDRGRLYRLGMRNGGNVWWYMGIKEDNLVRLEEYLIDNKSHDIWKAGHKAQQIVGGPPFIFASEEEMRSDNSAANREVIRKYINDARQNRIDWRGIVELVLSATLAGIGVDKLFFKKPKPKIPAADLTPLLEALKSQLNHTTQDNAELRSKNSLLEDQVKGLKDEVERLTSQFGGALQQNETLRSDKDTLETQAKKFKDEIDALNKVRLKLHTDNGLLTMQLEELRLKFNELQLQFNGAAQDNVTLRTNKGTLETQARRLKDDVDKLSQEIERIKTEKAQNTQGNPKNPEWVTEWITGEQEFAKSWQVAKRKLSPVRLGQTGEEPEYVRDRFKAGMDVIHEISLATIAAPNQIYHYYRGFSFGNS